MSVLLVCSVGGHLAELRRLLPRIPGIDGERTWVTFDTPQSRSVLDGEEVVFVDYTGPRDVARIARHALRAHSLLGGERSYSTAISTGSGIALSFLPLARARGASCHYIESFTRPAGPSATGRALSRFPGIRLYTQHRSWARGAWRYRGSVFDEFAPAGEGAGATAGAARARAARPRRIRRAVVTLGTMEDYAFPLLVERALAVLPPQAQVLWQVGCTDVSPYPIDAHRTLPASALRDAIAAADVVIAHAGCGSSMLAMEAGKTPLLVPRRSARGENVDDHQVELAAELERRGLAVVREVDRLTSDAVARAAAGAIVTRPRAAPFRLAE